MNKEFSIKEKAQRYDEAVERAKKWYNAPNVDKIPTFGNRVIEDIFPELKESEDERIRKELIKLLRNLFNNYSYFVKDPFYTKCMAWLEKQGNLMKALQISNAKIGELIEENYYLKEKQGEQKPAEEYNITGIGSKHAEGKLGEMIKNLKPTDNVEPKFKVGDTVKDPYEQCIQYASIESGIKANAEEYSFNIESELFNQLTKEQQKLWRKEIEQAVISGGYNGLNLAKDPRYKENLEVKEVDLEKELDSMITPELKLHKALPSLFDVAKHFFELGLRSTITEEDCKLIWNIGDEIPYMPKEEFFKELLRRYKAQKGEEV